LSKLGLVVEDMQAQSALRTLILNMDDYRKIRADLGKSGGTVQAAFAQREALDASVAWQSFTGTMSALAITLGATLLPSVTQFFGWVNTGVSAIARWAQANPELAGQIMTLASAFIAGRMALGALQFGFGSALSGLATLRNGFMMARTAAAFLIPVLGSIGLVPLLIVGGLIAAGAAIYLFRDRLMAGWTAIKAAWDGAPAWMRAIGGMMMDGLLNALIPGRLASRLLEIAQAGMTAFRNYFGIKSPSRLMMEMGGHITTGLGQGITGGTAQPLRAMGQMARRVAGAGALSLAGPSLAPSAMPGFARTGPQGATARAAPARRSPSTSTSSPARMPRRWPAASCS
jgi:hypothetical protein